MTPSQQLKLATKVAHESIERNSVMASLMSPSLTIEQYALALESLRHWLLSLQYYQDVDSALPHIDLADKIHRLEQDLYACNCPPRVPDNLFICAEEHAVKYPEALNNEISVNLTAFTVGVLYVVEGSSLGGQIIARRVSSVLKRDDITHFYQLYADNTFDYWHKTQTFIDAQLDSKTALTQAIAGAHYAFDLLQFYATSQKPQSGKEITYEDETLCQEP